ncbi:hypothetical protein [Marivita hallyeonensis]|uniref:hypothetical protein n=1 Tax=Marivita hallyeonensis TaxID=996342 RepID=UPI0011606CB5|nr:hypothetical protein [Marivita hallyeonensis]
MTQSLHEALLEAHAKGDKRALMALYEDAAEQSTDDDAVGFFLTHAYIFALDCGDARATELRGRLVSMGRETNG